MEENSKRIIPEYEIGLAILHCSTDKYCNPSFKMSQTMSLTVPNDSAQLGLCDAQRTPNENTETMDLVISETNEISSVSLGNENPATNESASAVDNSRKRKMTNMELNENDDQDLFQFESKKICRSNDNLAANQDQNKPSNNNVFLQKGQQKIVNNNCPEDQPTTSKEPRKRPLIKVLDENDEENEDDLFSFGDTQKSKRIRQQNGEEGKGDDDDLFTFKERETSLKTTIKTIEIDEDSNDMESTQKIVVVAKKPPVQIPKPKTLPQKISLVEWMSSSLGKMNLKKENLEVKNENIKSDLEIKPDPDEITITEDHRKWLESLKDAIEIQQVSLSNNLKCADKSRYKLKARCSNSEEISNNTILNFKKFVKVIIKKQTKIFNNNNKIPFIFL